MQEPGGTHTLPGRRQAIELRNQTNARDSGYGKPQWQQGDRSGTDPRDKNRRGGEHEDGHPGQGRNAIEHDRENDGGGAPPLSGGQPGPHDVAADRAP